MTKCLKHGKLDNCKMDTKTPKRKPHEGKKMMAALEQNYKKG